MFRAPLWQHLVVLWIAAIAVSAALIAFDVWRARPRKFFWLIPYPNLRLLWPTLVAALRAKPILVTGIFLVPLLAVLATVALVSARLAILLAG